MITSHTHRAIFVHIPKTAGTSVTALIEPQLRWNDLVLGGTTFGEQINLAYKQRFGISKHAWARNIRSVVGEDIWARYFTFAIVRRPYTRIASFYAWTRIMVNRAATDSPVWSWPATDAFLQSKSFSEFIRHEKFLTSISGQPQADWVCDETASCIVDFVGRCEHLEETVKTITMQIGLTAGPLGVQNTSTADHPVGSCCNARMITISSAIFIGAILICSAMILTLGFEQNIW